MNDATVFYGDCTAAANSTYGVCYDKTANVWKYWSGGVWNQMASGAVPSGADIIITSGSCPAGYSEDTSVQGYCLVAKTATGSVGGTLGTAMTGATLPDSSYTPNGSNGTVSFTPAGTNATVSFTPSGTNGTGTVTPAGTNSTCATVKFTTSGSGTAACSPAFTPTFTGSSSITSAEVFTGSAGTVPAEVFTGSAGTVSAEAFTGSANTTMRSTIGPAIQVILCKKI